MQILNDSNTLELDFERICILYANVKFAIFGTAAAICFLYFVIYKYSSPGLANLWVAFNLFAYIPRIILSILFMRKLKNQEITLVNVKSWEDYMTLSCIFPYLCFVAVIFLPYGENEFLATAICALMFMTMATGGALALTTSLGPIMLYTSLAMFSIIGKSLLLHDMIFTLLAFFMFIGYLLIIRLIIRQNKTLIENITLKIHNKLFSLIDPLTKLGNRRRLDLHVEKLVPASRRSGDPFSLIILDIDHFKEYNDTNGHAAGDELLIKVADILQDCSREQDLVVRYGGEEFIVLLPQTLIKYAEMIAERIRITVKEKTGVTISAGLAEFHHKTNFDQLLQKADAALYTAKRNGRDQYVLAPT